MVLSDFTLRNQTICTLQDVTPEAVMAFLPPHTLADDVIQNVHIMLDRNDGKAKDYLVCLPHQ